MWIDSDLHLKLLDKLRQKLRRMREARKGDQDRCAAKAAALWKHAEEARPVVYRQMLFEALAPSGGDGVIDLPEEWT